MFSYKAFRLLRRYFPRVFGETDDEPLQTSAAMTGFKALTHEVTTYFGVFSNFCYELKKGNRL